MEVTFKLKKRISELMEIRKKAEKSVKESPKGYLRVSRSGKRIRYYRKGVNDSPDGIYIRRKDRAIACTLAQKEYAAEVARKAEHDIGVIERFLKAYSRSGISDIYTALDPARQILILPFEVGDEEYEKAWREELYEAKKILEDDSVYYTGRNEQVRSKSEALIADLYDRLGIPYKYECPLRLGERVVYPDFTLLHVRERRVVYHEHFGMVDNEDYARNMVRKINAYQEAGFTLGVDFIATFETSLAPMNMRWFRGYIESMF